MHVYYNVFMWIWHQMAVVSVTQFKADYVKLYKHMKSMEENYKYQNLIK